MTGYLIKKNATVHYIKNVFSQKAQSYRFYFFSDPRHRMSGDYTTVNGTSVPGTCDPL